MASKPQLVRPETKELVTQQILAIVGLNAQAFSGNQNPSTIYRQMVSGSPSVFPLYRELEEKDTAVGSALDTRRLLTLARDRNIQAADPQNGQAVQFAEEASAFLDRIPKFKFALWELLDAPGYGFAVCEILWSLNEKRVEATLVGRPQEIFRFGPITQPQTGELVLATNVGGEGQPVGPFKFLVATYRPRHGDRRGLALLRRLFWPSWFKRNALRLDLHFLERPVGTVAVQYSPSASPEEQDKARDAANAIVKDLAVAVPESFKILESLLTSTRTRDGKDYQTMIDYFDAEMTRIILGQTLATRGSEQQHGTLSLGKVHLETLVEYIRGDAEDLEFVINEQLLAPWGLFTFGPQFLERALRPWWTIDKEPPKDLARAADLLIKARSLSLEIPRVHAHEKLQIPTPEKSEPILPPPADPFGSGASVGPVPPPEEAE